MGEGTLSTGMGEKIEEEEKFASGRVCFPCLGSFVFVSNLLLMYQ